MNARVSTKEMLTVKYMGGTARPTVEPTNVNLGYRTMVSSLSKLLEPWKTYLIFH